MHLKRARTRAPPRCGAGPEAAGALACARRQWLGARSAPQTPAQTAPLRPHRLPHSRLRPAPQVVARNCLSVGEALRALDQKDIIKGDFILVSGDTVANVDMAPALAAHRARREKDKNAIMTMVGWGGVGWGAEGSEAFKKHGRQAH
jgi:hypothetical protein